METATQTLHRLTSYTWDWYEPSRGEPDLVWTVPVDDPRVLRDLEVNDLDHLPWFYKRYGEDLPRVPLPRDLPATTAPAVSVLAGAGRVSGIGVDLPHLSRLLHLSAGVVRVMVRARDSRGRAFPEPTSWLFRAAGSAGGRFPLELYVAVPDGAPGLPPGVHWYHPEDHALVRIGPPPSGDAPVIVITGVPWRTGWRYRERGFRHVYWDAGTMLAQLLAVADSAGHATRLHTIFPDEAVAALIGADRVHEWPVAVVALGDGTAALEPTGQAATGEVDAAPIELPLVTRAQRSGERDVLGEAWDRGAPGRRSDREPESDRDRRLGARVPEADGSEPGSVAAPVTDGDAGGHARHPDPASRRRPRRRGIRTRRLPLAGPLEAGACGQAP